MISSLLYLLYAVAAAVALLRGTLAAAVAGSVVTAYLVLRVVRAAAHRSIGPVPAPAPELGRP